jgi:hypothetical protein
MTSSGKAKQNFAAKKSDQQTPGQPSFILTPGAESWAKARLVPWGKLQKDARESYEFRCFLALDKRERGQFPAIGTKFQRSSEGNIHLLRSGWETWLYDFADELVANKSFAEVLRTNRINVMRSLAALAGYDRYPKAVELPGRYINVPGIQEVTIQIDWRHYNNREIGAEMVRWAANHRPEDEPEPDRTGKKRKSRVRADLKALSTLRISKLYKKNRWKRLEYVAKFCGYEGCVREFAEHKHRKNRWQATEPISSQARKEMSGARTRALKIFQYFFPWGMPSNY